MNIEVENFDAPRVAIDFETSGSYGASACAIGITRIENGKIVKNFIPLFVLLYERFILPIFMV